jgi:aryl-alcohol dehydrogenase-like predicted oxidoreductase
MRYRQLGESDLTVSVIGLGGNNFGGRIGLEETRGVVDAAIDCGVTLVDTADVYGNRGGSEEFLGQVLAGRREHVVLATKFGLDMGEGTVARGSRKYIRRAVEASLHRLQTDYIDLYQYHEPDGLTPLEETLAAADRRAQRRPASAACPDRQLWWPAHRRAARAEPGRPAG